MGAIQSAINQGLATAGVLYSQSATAEQRKKDFADKRELKDINAQLEQLAPAREDLKKQANIWVENKADLKEIQKLPQDEQDTALRVEEDRLNKMKAGSELYHDMTIDLNKRKFGLTFDDDIKFEDIKRIGYLDKELEAFGYVKDEKEKKVKEEDEEEEDIKEEKIEVRKATGKVVGKLEVDMNFPLPLADTSNLGISLN